MKAILSVLALLVVSFSVSAGNAQSVQFRGVVQRDSSTPVRFDLQVPAKRHLAVELDDGSRLELAAPGGADPSVATARLVSSSGQVLHNAAFTDPGLASTSFAYLVCAGRVTYISPAPAKDPTCPRG